MTVQVYMPYHTPTPPFNSPQHSIRQSTASSSYWQSSYSYVLLYITQSDIIRWY